MNLAQQVDQEPAGSHNVVPATTGPRGNAGCGGITQIIHRSVTGRQAPQALQSAGGQS